MIIKHKHFNFGTPEERKRIINFVSTTIEGRKDFIPYKPNEHDDRFWTLDSGNDWKILFYDDKPDQFRITYRYNSPEVNKEERLCKWLQVRFSMFNPVEILP